MDSFRRIINYHTTQCIVCVILLLLFGSAFAKQEQQGELLSESLRELRWLGNDVDKVAALTQQPTECLNPKAPKTALAGRLAFASPALLGGQAARLGLSCASCHPAARNNPHFFIAGISGTNGTADVTHSFFSSTGGNQEMNPTHIPDLANLSQNTIKDRRSAQFTKKLRQLIEVEFDGQAAPTNVLSAIQDYLLHTDLTFCDQENAMQTIKLAQDWQDLLATVEIIQDSNLEIDANFYTRVARQQLETIYHRYFLADNTSINQGLIRLSRLLQSITTQYPTQQAKTKKRKQQFKQWQQQAQRLHRLLQQKEKNSGYNANVLRPLINAQLKH